MTVHGIHGMGILRIGTGSYLIHSLVPLFNWGNRDGSSFSCIYYFASSSEVIHFKPRCQPGYYPIEKPLNDDFMRDG